MAKQQLSPQPSFGYGPGAKAGVNTIKRGGILQSSQKKPKEADSASTMIAQLRPEKKKEAAPPPKANFHFRESTEDSFKEHKFQVCLIREGLGNFKDRFFYTKESLKGAAESGLFEGSQCFANHPSQIEEEVLPERSVKDILGYYENVTYQENALGQGELVAELCVSESISLDWAISLLTNSIEYSKKFKEADLVGLSINASGSASPVSIDEFIKSQKLADPVIQKLSQAKEQGISEINVVDALKEAQSVDMVTKAGAGGRILQMLEQEKNAMIKKGAVLKESEGMEKKETEGGAPAQADGATADHADAGQDMALFKKMIKQYLGKDDASPEEMEMAHHAHEAAKEMGMEGEKAYEAAGNHLKMASKIGQKMCQKHEAEGEAKHESEAEGEAHHEAQTPPPNPKSTEGHKESMKIAELTGQVAKLTEIVKKGELKEYLDQKCAESGKPNSVTKKFREALGTPKSKEQIDSTWNVFMKAFDAGTEEVGSQSVAIHFGEKRVTNRESSGSGSKKVGFAHAVKTR